MDEVTHTILEQPNNMGFGGLGSGFVGGIIGGALFGNGGFGWGGNRGGVGYDTGAINGMANQLNTISGQIANADRDLLMQTANSNQFVGNLVNSTGDAIVGSINSNARDIQAGIFQNTLTQTQNQGATNLAMCQGFGGLNSSIDKGVGLLNSSIVEQELQREIQYQNKVDELAQSRTRVSVLENQLFTQNVVGNAITTIINALKPATTTAGA